MTMPLEGLVSAKENAVTCNSSDTYGDSVATYAWHPTHRAARNPGWTTDLCVAVPMRNAKNRAARVRPASTLQLFLLKGDNVSLM